MFYGINNLSIFLFLIREECILKLRVPLPRRWKDTKSKNKLQQSVVKIDRGKTGIPYTFYPRGWAKVFHSGRVTDQQIPFRPFFKKRVSKGKKGPFPIPKREGPKGFNSLKFGHYFNPPHSLVFPNSGKENFHSITIPTESFLLQFGSNHSKRFLPL